MWYVLKSIRENLEGQGENQLLLATKAYLSVPPSFHFFLV